MDVSMQWALLGKTLVAMAYAGVIGFERELAGKPAGLRTHMFVSGAATLMVVLSELIVGRFAERFPDAVMSDPIRIFEAIVVGVSFIGAGTIVQRQEASRIEGLTTAASLLMVTGIGIAVALDLILLAGAITAAVMVVGVGLRFLEHRYVPNE
jgi:putative Mg2+ transporter-C (MgtC) family protein